MSDMRGGWCGVVWQEKREEGGEMRLGWRIKGSGLG